MALWALPLLIPPCAPSRPPHPTPPLHASCTRFLPSTNCSRHQTPAPFCSAPKLTQDKPHLTPHNTCIYAHTCRCTHTHADVHINMHTHAHRHMWVRTHTGMLTCSCTHVCAHRAGSVLQLGHTVQWKPSEGESRVQRLNCEAPCSLTSLCLGVLEPPCCPAICLIFLTDRELTTS